MGQVMMYQRLTGGPTVEGVGAGQWAFVGARRAHSHDVRALAVANVPLAEQVLGMGALPQPPATMAVEMGRGDVTAVGFWGGCRR